jgi:hypothetical protein
LVWAGAGLLGWVAGDIMIKDGILERWIPASLLAELHYWAAGAGALFVLGVGYRLARARRPEKISDV